MGRGGQGCHCDLHELGVPLRARSVVLPCPRADAMIGMLYGNRTVAENARRAAGLFVGVWLASGAALAGCFASKTCTLRGCQDQFHATVASTDGSIPSGMHVVDVTADGVTISCTFQVPLVQQPGGGTVAPQCPQGLNVFIGQASTCTETDTASSKSLTCVPIAGHFFEDITVTGKPTQLHVRLTVNGVAVLDRSETPGYTQSQPNGPTCNPVCQQADSQWTFSGP